MQLLVPMDVLDHHDRVVDQDTDRKDQREQRNPVQGEAPGPGGEQRDGEREHHRRADDRGFAPAQREEHQGHHRGGREQQLLDQLACLGIGCRAVVAGRTDLDLGRNDGVAQLFDASHDGVGDVDGVFAGLLGDGDRDRGKLAARPCPGAAVAGGRGGRRCRCRRGRRGSGTCRGCRRVVRPIGQAVPDQPAGRRGTVAHRRHVLQENRLAGAHADDEFAHFARVGQEAAGLHGHRAVAAQQVADRRARVRRLQRAAQVGDGDAGAGHSHRVEFDHHHPARAADRGDIASAGHALDLGLDTVGDAFEVVGAGLRIAREQREGNDGDVVDALGLDQRLEHAQATGQPVGMAADGVVQPDQRLGARHADLELHGQDRNARPRDRHHVLDPRDPGQHLFCRRGHHLLDLAHRGPREGDHHVGHGDVDLRLFLARRDHHREDAQQQGNQCQQRRDLGALEKAGDATGNAHGVGVGHDQRTCEAAWGSMATRSLADTPLSTSTRSA